MLSLLPAPRPPGSLPGAFVCEKEKAALGEGSSRGGLCVATCSIRRSSFVLQSQSRVGVRSQPSELELAHGIQGSDPRRWLLSWPTIRTSRRAGATMQRPKALRRMVGVVLSGWFGTVGCVWLVRYGWLVTKEALGVPSAFRWNSDGTMKKQEKSTQICRFRRLSALSLCFTSPQGVGVGVPRTSSCKHTASCVRLLLRWWRRGESNPLYHPCISVLDLSPVEGGFTAA